MTIRPTTRPLLARNAASTPATAPLLLVAAASMSLGVTVPIPLLRAAIVLPIALLAPGYAIVAVAFGPGARLGIAMTFTLSALLSMALYPLLALALYATSIRISTASVLIATNIVIVLCAGVVALCARAGPAEEKAAPKEAQFVTAAAAFASRRERSSFLLAVTTVVAITVIPVAVQYLPAAKSAPSTAFYLARSWSHLTTVAGVRPHQRLTVAVGITNRTGRRQTYRIVPLVDNQPAGRSQTATVRAGQSWTGTVAGLVPPGGCIHRLGIRLQMRGSRRAIALLTVWFHPTPVPARCNAYGRVSKEVR